MIDLIHKDQTIGIAENWNEVTFAQYVALVKLERLGLEGPAKMVRTIATISDKPELCEDGLNKLTLDSFNELCALTSFTDLTKVEGSGADYITIDSKRYRIKKDFNGLTIGEMSHFETLKDRLQGQEDHLLALGLLLREVGPDNEEQDFTVEGFDHIVNHLAQKVLMVDVYKHVDFFLRGESAPSSRTTPVFSIRRAPSSIPVE